MGIWIECIIGALASVGLVCIFKAMYDIIISVYMRTQGECELFLYADGCNPDVQQLINAALYSKRKYLPKVDIIFVQQGTENIEDINYAKIMCARKDIEYIE